MKRIVLVFLLFCVIANAEENITWSRAALLSQNAYPDLQTTPQSNPESLVDVNGEKYWVVEFDEVWVPVAYSNGKILTDETNTIKEVYEVHWVLQQLLLKSETDEYPTKHREILRIFKKDTKNHEDNLQANKGKLPQELETEANKLLSKTQLLRESLESAIEKTSQVNTKEEELLGSSTSKTEINNWKSMFLQLVGQLETISSNSESLSQEEVSFENKANEFLEQTDKNDTETINKVESFIEGYIGAIDSGTLSELGTAVSEWKTSFIGVHLNSTMREQIDFLYADYSAIQSERSIIEIQEAAHEKMTSLSGAPQLINKLYACYTDLDAVPQNQLETLNQSYYLAEKNYNEGNDFYGKLMYEEAEDAYLNSEEYARQAKDRYEKLEDVECPVKKEEPKTLMEIINDFIGTPTSIILAALVIVLIIIIIWNRRKGEDYYEEDDYTSLPPY